MGGRQLSRPPQSVSRRRALHDGAANRVFSNSQAACSLSFSPFLFPFFILPPFPTLSLSPSICLSTCFSLTFLSLLVSLSLPLSLLPFLSLSLSLVLSSSPFTRLVAIPPLARIGPSLRSSRAVPYPFVVPFSSAHSSFSVHLSVFLRSTVSSAQACARVLLSPRVCPSSSCGLQLPGRVTGFRIRASTSSTLVVRYVLPRIPVPRLV